MSMFVNFDLDEMNENEIHSLKQDVKKLKLQIEERDFCIRELQKIIEQIQETLEQKHICDNIYDAYILTGKAVDEAISLCKNSADSVIQKIEERRKENEIHKENNV